MPEVREVVSMLSPIKRKFTSCIIKSISIKNRHFSQLSKLSRLLPQRITSISNKGKFIYFTFTPNLSLGLSMGMTGSLVTKPQEYTRYILHTNCGDIYYNDPRLFGRVYVYTKPAQLQSKLSKLGWDVTKELPRKTTREFITRVRSYSPNTAIVDLLINQAFLAGIGNYLRSEILYSANIYPLSKLKSLTDKDLSKLKSSIQRICKSKNYKLKVYQISTRKIKRKGRTIYY